MKLEIEGEFPMFEIEDGKMKALLKIKKMFNYTMLINDMK